MKQFFIIIIIFKLSKKPCKIISEDKTNETMTHLIWTMIMIYE